MTKPQLLTGIAMMRAATLHGLDAAEAGVIVQGAERAAVEDLERQLETELHRDQVRLQWVALVLVVEDLEHQYSYQAWTPPNYPEGAQTLHCKATQVCDTPPKLGS